MATKNVGGLDRLWRVLVGPLLVAAAIYLFGTVLRAGGSIVTALVLPTVLAAAGVSLVWTARTQYCPINELLGVDTCDAATAD